MAKVILFVDDLHLPPSTPGMYYQVARNLNKAKSYLRHIDYTELSLDYALGESGDTTLDLLKFIKEQNITSIKTINIHTDNENRFELVNYIRNNFPNVLITHHRL